MLALIWDSTFGEPLSLRVFLELQRLGWYTLVATVVLDILNYSTVIRVIRNTPKLYAQSVFMNFFNHIIIPPLIFTPLARYILFPGSACDTSITIDDFRKDNLIAFRDFNWWLNMQKRPWCEESSSFKTSDPEGIIRCLGVLLIQSIGYYLAHMWMHRRENYWMHKFHHQYNKDVIPMTANAVHVCEYMVAYMGPIAAGALIAQPTFLGLLIAGYWISFTNLLIHTPQLHDLSDTLPEWLVTTVCHNEHHRILNGHYAAPTLNIDWFVAKIRGKTYGRWVRKADFSKMGVEGESKKEE